jgi:hypothetical protein
MIPLRAENPPPETPHDLTIDNADGKSLARICRGVKFSKND